MLSGVRLGGAASWLAFGMLVACTDVGTKPPATPVEPPRPRQDYAAPIGPDPEIVSQYHVGEIKKKIKQ